MCYFLYYNKPYGSYSCYRLFTSIPLFICLYAAYINSIWIHSLLAVLRFLISDTFHLLFFLSSHNYLFLHTRYTYPYGLPYLIFMVRYSLSAYLCHISQTLQYLLQWLILRLKMDSI